MGIILLTSTLVKFLSALVSVRQKMCNANEKNSNSSHKTKNLAYHKLRCQQCAQHVEYRHNQCYFNNYAGMKLLEV